MLTLTMIDGMLLGLAYLMAKHALADFFLQTKYQWANKGRYGHPGGLLHAAIHVALTVPVFLLLPPPTTIYGSYVLLAEFLVHYHCDWLKEQIVKGRGWTFLHNEFWRAMGIDQLVHGLTYLCIVRALV